MNITFLTRTALLLTLTLVIQAVRLPPAITGPVVNMLLISATMVAGTSSAVFIGCITPWLALIFGILPPHLFPALPFIMAGNVLYCRLFAQFYPLHSVWGGYLGVAAGSLAKFFVIGLGVKVLLALPSPLAAVLFWPQLFNALIGGSAALFLRSYFRRITGGYEPEPPADRSGKD